MLLSLVELSASFAVPSIILLLSAHALALISLSFLLCSSLFSFFSYIDLTRPSCSLVCLLSSIFLYISTLIHFHFILRRSPRPASALSLYTFFNLSQSCSMLTSSLFANASNLFQISIFLIPELRCVIQFPSSPSHRRNPAYQFQVMVTVGVRTSHHSDIEKRATIPSIDYDVINRLWSPPFGEVHVSL